MIRRARNAAQCAGTLVLLWLGGLAHAQSLPPITVPVADQSTAAREAALLGALDQAVTRLAGLQAKQSFWIAPAAVLTSYQYRRRDGVEATSAAPLELVVRFDTAALSQALRQNGHAVWSGPRPPLLIWVNGPGGWMDELEVARRAPELLSVVQQWGYTLRFPQLDMSERQQLALADIHGGIPDPWQTACAAYGMSWCLAVELREVPVAAETPAGQATSGVPAPIVWASRWTLADEREVVLQFAPDVAPLGVVVESALMQMNGPILAAQVQRDAVAANHDWIIQLEGMTGASDYLQMLAQLRAAGISASVQDAAPKTLTLRVAWRGSPREWRRTTQDWGWVELPWASPAEPPMPTTEPSELDGLSGFATEPAAQTRYRFRVPGS